MKRKGHRRSMDRGGGGRGQHLLISDSKQPQVAANEQMDVLLTHAAQSLHRWEKPVRTI